MPLHASCHCGQVRVVVPRRPRVLTQCNCSICRRYGALWAYYVRRSVGVTAPPGGLVGYRRRAGGAIEFLHCAICGCVTHYTRTLRRADGSDRMAVNARTLDEPAHLAAVPIRMLDGARTWAVLDRTPQPYLLRSPGDDEDPSVGRPS